MIAFVCV